MTQNLDSIKQQVYGLIQPNSCLTILFVEKNLYNMEQIGTDSTILYNPIFNLSQVELKGQWIDLYVTQDFDDFSDLDNHTDFKFNNLKVKAFVANNPWTHLHDYPL